MSGLWDGITSMASWLWDKVTDFCNSIVEGIQGALKINSPSRVMADQVGQYIPAGIAMGITDNASAVSDAMSALNFQLGSIAPSGSVTNSSSNSYYSYATNNGGDTVTVSIGDVIVEHANSANDLANAIVTRLPLIMKQKLYSR